MKKHSVYFNPPEHFKPAFQVAAVFLQVKDKTLLLQVNDKKIYANKWCVPGGKIEAGETIIESLIREVFEETNIVLPKEKLEFVQKIYIHYPEFNFEHNIFKISLPEVPASFKISNEHQSAKWVTKQEALKMDLIPAEYECFELAFPKN